MKKIDLQMFRKLKQEMLDLIEKAKAKAEAIAKAKGESYITKEDIDEEIQKLLDRHDEIMTTLLEFDLSDIDFEEWRGIDMLFAEDKMADFSKTKANLDFSIIKYSSSIYPNFKGCKIKNFDFDENYYSPDMFDEEFIKEHEERFLSENAPEEIRSAYYNRSLSVNAFSNNLQYFKGKKVEHSFSRYDRKEKLVHLYGEEMYQLFADYKPIMDCLSNDTIYYFLEVPKESVTVEQRKEIMHSFIINHFIIHSLKQLKMLSDFFPLEDLKLSSETKEFIKKYGIDNIIELDEETKGIFLHELPYSDSDICSGILRQALESDKKLESDEQLTYEEFRDKMYEFYYMK